MSSIVTCAWFRAHVTHLYVCTLNIILSYHPYLLLGTGMHDVHECAVTAGRGRHLHTLHERGHVLMICKQDLVGGEYPSQMDLFWFLLLG